VYRAATLSKSKTTLSSLLDAYPRKNLRERIYAMTMDIGHAVMEAGQGNLRPRRLVQIRRTRGQDEGREARLETRKGHAIFIASIHLFPVVGRQARANIGVDGWEEDRNQNPLVTRHPLTLTDLTPLASLTLVVLKTKAGGAVAVGRRYPVAAVLCSVPGLAGVEFSTSGHSAGVRHPRSISVC